MSLWRVIGKIRSFQTEPSQFDAYLGRLIRVLFYRKPEILHVSEKNLTFAQLLKFQTVEAAREYVIEKEVESVLRESHAEQFAWLERILGIPLRKDLAAWPSFIEVTERRNLFVHCDGVVSSQYLVACHDHGVQLESALKLGLKLEAEAPYLASAFDVVFEIGVKLGHVLWRKVSPGERATADYHLNSIAYELLVKRHYQLAIVLLDFALSTVKKHSSEEHRLMFLVNLGIAYSRTGQDQKCSQLLESIDWTAKSDKFKLARAVLAREDQDVARLMQKIGADGDVKKWDYRNWPLFDELRESAGFATTFEKIFGEPLRVPERDATAAVEDLLRVDQKKVDHPSGRNDEGT